MAPKSRFWVIAATTMFFSNCKNHRNDVASNHVSTMADQQSEMDAQSSAVDSAPDARKPITDAPPADGSAAQKLSADASLYTNCSAGPETVNPEDIRIGWIWYSVGAMHTAFWVSPDGHIEWNTGYGGKCAVRQGEIDESKVEAAAKQLFSLKLCNWHTDRDGYLIETIYFRYRGVACSIRQSVDRGARYPRGWKAAKKVIDALMADACGGQCPVAEP